MEDNALNLIKKKKTKNYTKLIAKNDYVPHKTSNMENISVLFNRVPEIPDTTDLREIRQKK